MRKTKLFIATIAMSMVLSSAAMAGTWTQDTTGWYYQNDDGSYPTNSWIKENGKLYYLKSDGYMATGWLTTTDGKWYYMNSTGEARTEDYSENGITYHFDENGVCQNPNETEYQSQENYDKNMENINKSLQAEAALRIDQESQTPDATPGVNLWNENIVSVTEWHR